MKGIRRKRITEIFPFLLPIRVWQKRLFCRIAMVFDKNKYCKKFGELLKYEICSTKTIMVNGDSGYDIIYQKNKVDNLKIASSTMNKILIYPGEVFSFYNLTKNSKKYGKYKKGLVLVDGKIVFEKGGGLCQLSNMLYYLFLTSPLTVIERHGHKVKSFPNPDPNCVEAIDATISEGWLDLRVRNDTDSIFQIDINFDDLYMYGRILSDKDLDIYYSIVNENVKYMKKNDRIYEKVSVVKIAKNKNTNEVISKDKLYDEVILIDYDITGDIEIEE